MSTPVKLASALPGARVAMAIQRSPHVRKVLDQLPTDECVEWPGRIDRQGYGLICSEISKGAHRYIYILLNGVPDLPELDHACHTRDLSCLGGPECRHRRCVNPAHLEPVSTAENGRRRAEGTGRCPKGHAYTEENTYKSPQGWRYCRECRRAIDRARGSGGARAAAAKSHKQSIAA